MKKIDPLAAVDAAIKALYIPSNHKIVDLSRYRSKRVLDILEEATRKLETERESGG